MKFLRRDTRGLRPVRGGPGAVHAAKANRVRGVRGNAGAMPKNGTEFAGVDDPASTRRTHRESEAYRNRFQALRNPQISDAESATYGRKNGLSLWYPLKPWIARRLAS